MASDVQVGPRVGVRALLEEHPLLVDALIALGLTLLSLVTIAGGAGDFGSISPISHGVHALLQTVPLVARRIAPVPVFIVTFGALLGQGAVRRATRSTRASVRSSRCSRWRSASRRG